jgi:hypothetical protein
MWKMLARDPREVLFRARWGMILALPRDAAFRAVSRDRRGWLYYASRRKRADGHGVLAGRARILELRQTLEGMIRVALDGIALVALPACAAPRPSGGGGRRRGRYPRRCFYRAWLSSSSKLCGRFVYMIR